MKILVIGGAGYIGSHFSAHALEQLSGAEVSIIDDLSSGNLEAIEAIEFIAQKKVAFYQIDILDLDALQKAFQAVRPDCVVHVAEKNRPPLFMVNQSTCQ
tara:strand:- start:1753 stop:2052 length:300 start_codon:yes stop_codon:yes gene_type:complete